MAYSAPKNGFRTFVIVWLTQSVSVFGTALSFFAINIWLTQSLFPLPEQRPQLAFALSAISLAFALPVVFGAPIAGAWADRYDRKSIMIAGDFLSGLTSLALMYLIIQGMLTVPVLVVLVVAFAIFGAFHNAAFDTSYAMLVPEEQLPRANGMMQTIWSLSGVLSPMLAATIIALPAIARQSGLSGPFGQLLAGLRDGTALAIGLDAITFFFAALVLLFLNIPSPKRTDLLSGDGKKKSLWADVRQGALYIWQRRPLLWLLGTFALANFTAGPMGVFQPLLVKFTLAEDWALRGLTFETALAALATAGGIGGIVGGVFISSWGGLKKKRVYGVLVALIISSLAQVTFGLSPWIYLSAAMVIVSQAMIPIMNAHSQTIWQTQVPRELQGRVFSVRRLIAQFTWPLSTFLAGWAGGVFDPGVVLAVLGGLLFVFCVGQLFNPYMLQVENKAFLDDLAGKNLETT